MDTPRGATVVGERPFSETLPEQWRPLAHSLYDALRTGIVQGCDTQRIYVDGRDIVVGLGSRPEYVRTTS